MINYKKIIEEKYIKNNKISKSIRFMKDRDPDLYQAIQTYWQEIIKKYNLKDIKNSDSRFIHKVYAYYYQIIPKCKNKNCNIIPRFTSGKFKKYCSNKCAMQDPEYYEHHIKIQKSKEVNEKRSKSLKKSAEKMKKKLKKISLEKYGVVNPSQKHLKNLDKLNKEFIERNFITKDKNFLVKKFMNFYGYRWDGVPYRILKKLNIEYEKFKSTSQFENEIVNFIKEIYSGKIIKNDKKIIYPKELDIYIPEKNLAIEFNGLFWHSFNQKELKNEFKYKHLEKTKEVEAKNINLLHIFENEWVNPRKQEIWKSVISYKLGVINKKYYARKLKIKEVTKDEAINFLEENHLQGFIQSPIKIGLYLNDELISIMTFGKSRFNKKAEYELYRFASKKFTACVGCAQKLFKHFIEKYQPKSVISYANRRWAYSKSNIYQKLGFEFIGESEPNYFYFKLKGEIKNIILYPRNKFQRYKIRNIVNNKNNSFYEDFIKIYSENKSESDLMFGAGFRRIYDAGNLVYLWNNYEKRRTNEI